MVEPVKRVGDGHGRHGFVGQWDRLGEPLAHALAADACREQLAQLQLGLDGYDIEPDTEQCPRELPCPGRQIEYGASRGDAQLGGNRADDGGRVLRSSELVYTGHLGEPGGEWMQRHAWIVNGLARVASAGQGRNSALNTASPSERSIEMSPNPAPCSHSRRSAALPVWPKSSLRNRSR